MASLTLERNLKGFVNFRYRRGGRHVHDRLGLSDGLQAQVAGVICACVPELLKHLQESTPVYTSAG